MKMKKDEMEVKIDEEFDNYLISLSTEELRIYYNSRFGNSDSDREEQLFEDFISQDIEGKKSLLEEIKEIKETTKEPIEIDEDFLKDLIVTIEQTTILLEDNPNIKSEEDFYNSGGIRFDLLEHLKYLKGEK